MKWTTERCDQLKSMRAEGHSFGRIAIEMKISRNAAIGKASRLGLPIVERGEVKMRTPKPKPRHRPEKRAQWKPSVRLPEPQIEPEPIDETAADLIPLIGAGVSLLDLRSDQCHWPYGDGPFVFCGQPADMATTAPYCAGHARIAYQAPQRRRERRPLWRDAA